LSHLISSEKNIKTAWRTAFHHAGFRIQFILTMAVTLSFSVVFHYYFPYVESRTGRQLSDFVLSILPPADVSHFVFFFLYSGMIIGLLSHLSHPKVILVAFQTYVLVTLMRIVTIYLLPLEPPVGYVPLKEPFVQMFTPGGQIISKDLFFSGHMSTILSLFLPTHLKFPRNYLLVCCISIAVLLLVQHVHYTIDVLFAIPATIAVYYFCRMYLGGKSY
jgi:hypothetical protein